MAAGRGAKAGGDTGIETGKGVVLRWAAMSNQVATVAEAEERGGLAVTIGMEEEEEGTASQLKDPMVGGIETVMRRGSAAESKGAGRKVGRTTSNISSGNESIGRRPAQPSEKNLRMVAFRAFRQNKVKYLCPLLLFITCLDFWHRHHVHV